MTAVADPHGTGHAPPGRPGFWRRAPGWVFYAASAFGGALLVGSASYPLGGILLALPAVCLLAVCAVAWAARLFTCLVARFDEGPRPRLWSFAIAPVAAVGVVALTVSGAPFALRWGLSEGAFDHRADQLAARAEEAGGERTRTLLHDDRIALYEVTEAWVDGSGNVYFTIAGSGFIDAVGIARIEGAVPPPGYHDYEFEHLSGDWYTYVQPF